MTMQQTIIQAVLISSRGRALVDERVSCEGILPIAISFLEFEMPFMLKLEILMSSILHGN